MYRPHDTAANQTGNLKIYEGSSVSNIGKVLYTDAVLIPVSTDNLETIYEFIFKKPVRIQANVEITIHYDCIETDQNVWYGIGGSDNIKGEKNVDFNFKFPNGWDTSQDSGQIPEIYYMV